MCACVLRVSHQFALKMSVKSATECLQIGKYEEYCNIWIHMLKISMLVSKLQSLHITTAWFGLVLV